MMGAVASTTTARTADLSWPPIRQANMSPVAGGWNVSYKQDGLSLQVNGYSPHSVLEQIISHRQANGLEIDADALKLYLEEAWYKRSPERFFRKPRIQAPAAPPVIEDLEKKAVQTLSSLLVLVPLSGKDQDYWAPQVLSIVASDIFDCERCVEITRDLFTERVKDWHYVLMKRLNDHVGVVTPPKALLSKKYNWVSI